MANTLDVTLKEILSAVQRYMGFGRETSWGTLSINARGDVLEAVNRGLRQFYAPPPMPGESSSHEWTFLRGNGTIDTEAVYTTGTITSSGTTVTGQDTSATDTTEPTFTSAMVGRPIRANNEIREIASFTNSDVIEIDRAFGSDITISGGIGAAYEIWALVSDLPSDFGGLRGSVTFYDGDGYVPLRLTNESNMRILRSRSDTRKGVPEYAALINKTITSDTTSKQAYQLMVWPVPDAVYSLRFNYSVMTDSVMEDAVGNIAETDGAPAPRTGNVPVGGMLHGDTIIASCLTVAEQLIDEFNNPGKMQARYMERLAASISLDRRSNMPDYFGYNGDNSDSQSFDPSRRNQPVTFNSTEYP
jgi:hypothetical protein